MSFEIGNLIFQVKKAQLYVYGASNGQQLSWTVEIDAHERVLDEMEWRPSVKTNKLFTTKVGEISHWNRIRDQHIEWNTGYENDEEKGFLYVFEHSIIKNCRIDMKYVRGLEFQINWSGTADINADPYNDNVPFKIVTAVTFGGVWCGKSTEAESRTMVAPFLPEAQFKFVDKPFSKLIPSK